MDPKFACRERGKSLSTQSAEYMPRKSSALNANQDITARSITLGDTLSREELSDESHRSVVLKQRRIIVRENKLERAKKIRDYDKSKLMAALDCISASTNQSNATTSTNKSNTTSSESEQKVNEIRNSLSKSLKVDFNI